MNTSRTDSAPGAQNPGFLKSVFSKSLLWAFLIGGLLGGGCTSLYFVGYKIEPSESSALVGVLLLLPGLAVAKTTGFEHTQLYTHFETPFFVLINGLIIALVFGVLWLLYKILRYVWMSFSAATVQTIPIFVLLVASRGFASAHEVVFHETIYRAAALAGPGL